MNFTYCCLFTILKFRPVGLLQDSNAEFLPFLRLQLDKILLLLLPFVKILIVPFKTTQLFGSAAFEIIGSKKFVFVFLLSLSLSFFFLSLSSLSYRLRNE